jgi:hypothetical protein
MGPALLILVDVVVQIILRSRHELSYAHVVVIHDLGMSNRDARVMHSPLPRALSSLSCRSAPSLRPGSPLGLVSTQLLGPIDSLVSSTLLPCDGPIRKVIVLVGAIRWVLRLATRTTSSALLPGKHVFLPEMIHDKLLNLLLRRYPFKFDLR